MQSLAICREEWCDEDFRHFPTAFGVFFSGLAREPVPSARTWEPRSPLPMEGTIRRVSPPRPAAPCDRRPVLEGINYMSFLLYLAAFHAVRRRGGAEAGVESHSRGR